MNWPVVGRMLRLVFLLRVPLAILIVLMALGPAALNSNMIGNLLDQGANTQAMRDWYLFTVSFSAFLLAFTAITTLNLALIYGSDRFDEAAKFGLSQKRPLLTFICGSATALTLVGCVYLRTVPRDPANLWFLFLGFTAALGLVIVAKVAQLALTDPNVTRHPPPFLVFPAYTIPFAEHIFDNIYCWSSDASRATKSTFNRVSQWPLEILRGAGQGYLINLDPPPGQPLRVKSGHVFALSLSVIAFFTYLGIGLVKAEITNEDARVPGLAFVLLFLIVACWALSAATFFFDRYHFPLLWTILLVSTITAFVPQSDHFFRVETRALKEPPTAAAYMKKRLASHRRLIFVATPGGGIQAAAWTAQVLTQLNQTAPGFRDSVAGISSVSGGSLGSIIYAASFAKKIQESEVAENARRSAIDEVAWGWTVPDFWRTILPWFRINRAVDRGWALEKKWAVINNLDDSGRSHGTMLSDWAEAARNGTMPALLINSMLVERGQPVVFTNTRFPAVPSGQSRIVNFYDLYPGQYLQYDVRVNTAARLSASFSYVAPSSRPDLNGPFAVGFHFVDGGYYDNFGITSLLSWLAEALDDDTVRTQVKDILILQIRHFNPGTDASGSRQGWGFQLAAPPNALFNMRDYAQESTARKQLELFAKYYASRGVNVWKSTIIYNGAQGCNDAPLSWKLDQHQQQCITETWTGKKEGEKVIGGVVNDQKPALECINSYVHDGDPAISCKKAGDPGE